MKPLLELIQKHTYILGAARDLTKNIKDLADQGRIEELLQQSENRERLINLLSYIQTKIEDMVMTMNLEECGNETLEALKNWQLDFNRIIEVIDDFNLEIIGVLESNKDETIKEIAALFKSKENFKGYNLNNVKK